MRLWQSRTWATLTWQVTPASRAVSWLQSNWKASPGAKASGMKTGCAPAPRSAIQRRA